MSETLVFTHAISVEPKLVFVEVFKLASLSLKIGFTVLKPYKFECGD